MKYQTIKRTRGRRYPLMLMAAHADHGPYLLVDMSGMGAAWRQPATETRHEGGHTTWNKDLGVWKPTRYASTSSSRHVTWVPFFRRAKLAFDLVEMDDDLTPREAKKVADEVYRRVERGGSFSASEIEALAWYLVDKHRARPPARDARHSYVTDAQIHALEREAQRTGDTALARLAASALRGNPRSRREAAQRVHASRDTRRPRSPAHRDEKTIRKGDRFDEFGRVWVVLRVRRNGHEIDVAEEYRYAFGKTEHYKHDTFHPRDFSHMRKLP